MNLVPQKTDCPACTIGYAADPLPVDSLFRNHGRIFRPASAGCHVGYPVVAFASACRSDPSEGAFRLAPLDSFCINPFDSFISVSFNQSDRIWDTGSSVACYHGHTDNHCGSSLLAFSVRTGKGI